jgi:hypothetical protein
MKLAHILLISASAVIIVGILVTAISGINASQPFLNQNILIRNDIIKAGDSKSAITNVTSTGPMMYIVIKSDPSNIPMSTLVKDPKGSIVSVSRFSQDLIANFRPTVLGKYNLVVTNEGTTDVKTNTIFGYIPLFGENQKPNYDALGGIFTGASLLVLGCFGFAVGIIIFIKDKSPRIEENMHSLPRLKIAKIIRYFKRRLETRKKTSSLATIDEDESTIEELAKLEKLRDEGEILESEFLQKKQELTSKHD